MSNSIAETTYPKNFREETTRKLGEHLRKRHSVVLIGMRKVGISNFLRFFLNHKDIVKTYIDDRKHIFIPVDLNDLVEREIYPFWVLTLKRIVDSAEKSQINIRIKKELQDIFLDSVQSQDLFLLIDGVRKALVKIVDQGFLPTIFFIRFDRIKDAINEDFFPNLEGLKEATNLRLSFVFTAYRTLNELVPKLAKHSFSLVADIIYLKPAAKEDLEIIYKSSSKHYHLNLKEDIKKELFILIDGYTQYLFLSLITLSQTEKEFNKPKDLTDLILNDETIKLQSEELWESLTEAEKEVVNKVINGKKIDKEDFKLGKYLFDTGLIHSRKNAYTIFSLLFTSFVKEKNLQTPENFTNSDFSKKEYSLFSFLQKNLDKICEREEIIENVWKEEEELGISDWAVDRLVARLRNKLKQQNSVYEIITIKTRGFKLISN